MGNGESEEELGDYRYCTDNIGLGMNIDRVEGDLPIPNVFLRNEKIVIYRPLTGHLGPDYFTYKIYDGLNVQEHQGLDKITRISEVSVHVRNCRKYKAEYDNLYISKQDPSAT